MARRRSKGGGGAAIMLAAIFLAPGCIAYHWPAIGWLIVTLSVLAFGGWVHARWTAGANAANWPSYMPRTKAVPLLAVWLGPVAYGGVNYGEAARVAEAAALVRRDAEAQEQRRQQFAREETERQRRVAEERAIQALIDQPVSEKIAEATTRINLSDEADLEGAVCHAAWVAAGLDAEATESREGRDLARLIEKSGRKVIAGLRRDAMEARGLLCADGTVSPSCSCTGSHQGCCSHHGGVVGCERAEPVKFECGTRSERDEALDHQRVLARLVEAADRR